MWNLIKKDYMLMHSNKWKVISFIISIPLLILLMGKDSDGSPIIISLVSVIVFNMVSNSESKVLIHSLPIKNSHVVLSKYIFIMINFIIISIYIIFIMGLLSRLGFVRRELINYYFVVTMQVSIIALSFVIPAFLNYSVNIGSTISWLIVLLSVNIYGALASDFQFFSKIVYNVFFNIGIGILLIISILCAIESYKNREFY